MLVEVGGDIFDSPLQTIACPVNSVGVMGAGLALAFKQRYPEVDRHYRALCRTLPSSFGDNVHVVHTQAGLHQVLLFPTKYHWQGRSTVEQIEGNLQKLVRYRNLMRIKSLALPALGCGLGGLSYEQQLLPLLRQYLEPIDLLVHVYRP